MVLWGRRADRRGTRSLHCAVPMVIGGLALAVGQFLITIPWIGYAGLCLSLMGVMSSAPAFFALPSTFLTGLAAAAGLAFINSVGQQCRLPRALPGRLGDRQRSAPPVGRW